ncbi:DEAD/DEAH box helicase [Pontibacillus yanchengensis]|uniref:Restriction endonuclease subunit R n=1 Tax=Pontibacillus yanchengensis Y32 TaxID=1385514 RepID=A0A0A2T8N1_9BACI|nr:DEAD/DEAH box helicase [Pontibacillus yanchengensis]KGP70773.1 hypothetical protein N782_04340 [Pontibacillus yanchengensis Y32]
MKEFPTDDDISRVVALLIDTYHVPDRLIKGVMGKEQINQLNRMLQDFSQQTMGSYQMARLVVMQKGAEVFSGSGQAVRELRKFLLKKLSDDTVKALYEQHPNPKKKITTPSYMYGELASKKWIPGGRWPKAFVRALGFPAIFAGLSQKDGKKKAVYEDVTPQKKVPKLVPYQEDMKQRMLDVLNREGDHTRCMLSLPTGGGKTRIAVESFIEWMHPRFYDGKYMIWIAQSEELCEQAITCISDMWIDKEFSESLRIYRYFGGSEPDPDDLTGGVVVASIRQIYSRLQNDDPFIQEVLQDCGAMIIDEAHHAASHMYAQLFEKAEELAGKGLFAVCGLTATPGRSDESTYTLVDRFEAYLIKPEFQWSETYHRNPLAYFRDEGYLARPKHIVYENNSRPIEVKEEEVFDHFGDFAPEFLRVLAADQERNKLIAKRLMEIPQGAPTLVYACTVEHAEFLASVMNALGRKAVSISAKTSKAQRNMYIDAFKRGDIEFLFNYGVLTTGFDAPKTEYIVICRPTTSAVLYEQIIGRGLRGPKFGGTSTCTIIDFADNILNLGPPLAYTRFHHLWELKEEVLPAR